jgi:hypothetical protein
MDYLGCKPNVKKFEPTLYKKADLLARVEEIKHEKRGEDCNRLVGWCHRERPLD